MYVDNNWYGHRGILAKYCGVKVKAMWGSIQHGVLIDCYESDIGKHSIPFSNYYCWTKKTVEYCKKNKVKNIIPIGAPFIYLDQLLKTKKSQTKSTGTLSFPCHSNPDDPRHFKHELFIKYVMDHYEGPFTACLFFLDAITDIKNIYSKYGWNVVSAGDRSNENFLENVYNFINRHDHIISPELGSSFFYSLFLKKKVSYIKKIKVKNTFQYFSQRSSYVDKPFFNDQLEAYEKKNNFILDQVIDIKKGKELGDIELGYEFKKSKDDLKKILGFNNLLKNIAAPLMIKIMNIKFKGFRNWGK